MMNAVQILFNDKSLGHEINFLIKRLEILKSNQDLKMSQNIEVLLDKFCSWQKDQNSEDTKLHWDHALLLTGL